RRWFMRYAAIVLLAAALGLAACSGGGSDTSSEPTGNISVLLDCGAATNGLQGAVPFGPVPSDVVAIGLSLNATNYTKSLSIGVAEGAFTFFSVPVGTNYSLTVTTVAAGGGVTT